ncbi:uncharacterized protein EI90DRAFT_3046472 [Cantharellus anzutake]|uniref:uncharacterized protein n=1 Tax=Cantharellus anzutake TaxID=1750568 RepID=UPI001903BC0E|nr:uncharacterized protein EI90DRAFT_3046472 [Cantharellus anzutake]KAF8336618.1 hypothetical protein EI90DRAFT_3046472 [Cantharellus anzutake]
MPSSPQGLFTAFICFPRRWGCRKPHLLLLPQDSTVVDKVACPAKDVAFYTNLTARDHYLDKIYVFACVCDLNIVIEDVMCQLQSRTAEHIKRASVQRPKVQTRSRFRSTTIPDFITMRRNRNVSVLGTEKGHEKEGAAQRTGRRAARSQNRGRKMNNCTFAHSYIDLRSLGRVSPDMIYCNSCTHSL